MFAKKYKKLQRYLLKQWLQQPSDKNFKAALEGKICRNRMEPVKIRLSP